MLNCPFAKAMEDKSGKQGTTFEPFYMRFKVNYSVYWLTNTGYLQIGQILALLARKRLFVTVAGYFGFGVFSISGLPV